MGNRKTYTGLFDIDVFCADCDWEYSGKNGLGLAAQHSDRYNHTVHCEISSGVTYTRDDASFHLKRQSNSTCTRPHGPDSDSGK